jgi:hypothetical protein
MFKNVILSVAMRNAILLNYAECFILDLIMLSIVFPNIIMHCA